MPRIRMEKELFKKVKRYAERAGYASAEEFVAHLLEQVVNLPEPGEEDADVMERLKGLGYIS
ncbi:MAG: hypothetical protein GY859_00105 [Desulfobacterales bacterium]|nr:hypothetical protein [Desulfobacterales bacterium]